jgi:hypothetical protein
MHAITYIPIVSVMTKCAQENGRGSYQKPFSTEALRIRKLIDDCSRLKGCPNLAVARGKAMSI